MPPTGPLRALSWGPDYGAGDVNEPAVVVATARRKGTIMVGMLLADDLRTDATQLLGTAAEITTRMGIKLTVLHVVEKADFEAFSRDHPDEGGYLDVLFEQMRGQLRSRLDEAVGPDRRAAVDVRVARGEADEVIAEQLRTGEFEFGAIGVRSRSRVNKLLFGSVAQSVLLQSPCPVVTIPVE